MLQIADVDVTMILEVSAEITPVCGSSCSLSSVADVAAMDSEAVTDVEMTLVCGSSCSLSSVADADATASEAEMTVAAAANTDHFAGTPA